MVRRLAFLAPPPMVWSERGGAMNARNLRDCRRFQHFAISKVPADSGIGFLERAIFATVATFEL